MPRHFTEQQLLQLGVTGADKLTPPQLACEDDTATQLSSGLQRRLDIVKDRITNHPVATPIQRETPAQRELRLREALLPTAETRQKAEHQSIQPTPGIGAHLHPRPSTHYRRSR